MVHSLRRLCPQYERQSTLSCPTETTRSQTDNSFFFSKLIPGFNLKRNIIFCSKLQLLPYLPGVTQHELRASYHCGRQRTIFGTKLKALRHKMFHIFPIWFQNIEFLYMNILMQSPVRNDLISMPFLLTYIDVGTVKFFPLVES